MQFPATRQLSTHRPLTETLYCYIMTLLHNTIFVLFDSRFLATFVANHCTVTQNTALRHIRCNNLNCEASKYSDNREFELNSSMFSNCCNNLR